MANNLTILDCRHYIAMNVDVTKNMGNLTDTNDPKAVLPLQQNTTLTHGKTSGAANMMYFRSSFIAKSGTVDLDLLGTLTNQFGDTVNFDSVKLIQVNNLSTTSTIRLVGQSFASWLKGAADYVVVPPEGVVSISSPNTGYSVSAGSDILRLQNTNASAVASYEISIVGVEIDSSSSSSSLSSESSSSLSSASSLSSSSHSSSSSSSHSSLSSSSPSSLSSSSDSSVSSYSSSSSSPATSSSSSSSPATSSSSSSNSSSSDSSFSSYSSFSSVSSKSSSSESSVSSSSSADDYGNTKYTMALYPFDGLIGELSGPGFYDYSIGGATHNLSNYGNVPITHAHYKFGGSSVVFNGSNYLYAGTHSDFNISGAYSFDCWVRFSSLPPINTTARLASRGAVTVNNGDWCFGLNNTGGTYKLNFAYRNSGAVTDIYSDPITPDTSTWYHALAVLKQDGNFYMYWSGTHVCSSSMPTSLTSSQPFYLGARDSSGGMTEFLSGYIDEARIESGICVINDPSDPLFIASGTPADGFTPPTAPYGSGHYYRESSSSSSSISSSSSSGV